MRAASFCVCGIIPDSREKTAGSPVSIEAFPGRDIADAGKERIVKE